MWSVLLLPLIAPRAALPPAAGVDHDEPVLLALEVPPPFVPLVPEYYARSNLLRGGNPQRERRPFYPYVPLAPTSRL